VVRWLASKVCSLGWRITLGFRRRCLLCIQHHWWLMVPEAVFAKFSVPLQIHWR